MSDDVLKILIVMTLCYTPSVVWLILYAKGIVH